MFIILVLSSIEIPSKSFIEQIKKVKGLSDKKIDNLTSNPCAEFVTAEENIRMKIPEIKIVEEFKEGDDEKFESFYADYMKLMIKKVIREKPRSQTICGTYTNCPGNHGLKSFTTTLNNFKCDECGYRFRKGTNMNGCRKCNFDLCTDCSGDIPVQTKNNITTMDYLQKMSMHAALKETPIESERLKQKVIRGRVRSQTICNGKTLKTLDYTNRLVNYSGLKESPIEPKLLSEDEEIEVELEMKQITQEKLRCQTICDPSQNDTAMNPKIEPEEDKMKMKAIIREKPRSQTLKNPVQTSKNFKTDHVNKIAEMLNKLPMVQQIRQQHLSEEQKENMLGLRIRKITLKN